jgi:hypothetical protein
MRSYCFPFKKTGDFVHPKNYDLINEVAFGSFVVESGP